MSTNASRLAKENVIVDAGAALATATAVDVSIQQGANVSGRPWKRVATKRASSLVKTSYNNQSSSWERKVADKNRRQQAKLLQAEMKESKRQEALAKKARRLENETRRAENELKAVQHSVQHLNANKIGTTLKAMSKKQLRMIKKTRLNTKTGVVEYVPAYAK